MTDPSSSACLPPQLIVTKDGSRGFINEFGTRLPGDTSSSSRGSFIILRYVSQSPDEADIH